MKLLSPQLLATLAVVGAFAAPAAFAQGTFTGAATGTNCNPGVTGTTYDSVSCTVGSVTANMQAWGFTGATLSSTPAAGFQRGRIGDFDAGGFGAFTGINESSTGNNHAFDNMTTSCGTGGTGSGGTVTLSSANSGCGGSIEALFLDFGTAKVNLSTVGIGFNGGDADLSVWMWTGSGMASISGSSATGSTTSLTSGTAAQIASGTTAASLSGWSLVSNHNFGAGVGNQSISGTLYSSAFLITTYFGAATSTLTAGNDSFKINSFTANTCAGTLSGGTTGTGAGGGNGASCSTTRVPEPGSLALAGLAMFGVVVTRRRRLANVVRG